MVKPGMERPYFQHNIFVSCGSMVTKERVLIKIETIKNSSNVLKKCMFLKKDDNGRTVFGSILKLALLNMLIHLVDDTYGKGTNVDYKIVVLCRIVESFFCMMLHTLGDVVKPRQLYPMKEAYGINWNSNVTTAQGIVKAFNSKYAICDVLVKVIDRYLETLEHNNINKDDLLDFECIFCLELLTSGPIGETSCAGQTTTKFLAAINLNLPAPCAGDVS
jgi:hypothetical protein